MHSIKTVAAQWYAKVSSQTLTDAENAELKSWLSEDPEHELAFLNCQIASDIMEQLNTAPQIKEIKETIKLEQSNRFPSFSRPVFSFPWQWQTGLAFMAMVLLTSVIMFHQFVNLKQLNSTLAYTTTLGEQKNIVLEDGSHIYLNTNSLLQVDYVEDRRLLALQHGEGLFDVEHDPKRPFDVVVGKQIIRAIGTRFNVHTNAKKVTVAVLEGKVVILDRDSLVSVHKGVLKPGMVASFEDNGKPVKVSYSTSELARVDAWLTGQMLFDDWPLSSAIDEHNRYSKKKIKCVSKGVCELRIAGNFQIGDTLGFLSALNKIHALEAINDGSDILLMEKVE